MTNPLLRRSIFSRKLGWWSPPVENPWPSLATITSRGGSHSNFYPWVKLLVYNCLPISTLMPNKQHISPKQISREMLSWNFYPLEFHHDNLFSLSEKSTSLPKLMNNGNVRTPSSSSQIFKPQPSHCQFLDHLLQQHKLAGLFQLLQPTRMVGVGSGLGLPSLS